MCILRVIDQKIQFLWANQLGNRYVFLTRQFSRLRDRMWVVNTRKTGLCIYLFTTLYYFDQNFDRFNHFEYSVMMIQHIFIKIIMIFQISPNSNMQLFISAGNLNLILLRNLRYLFRGQVKCQRLITSWANNNRINMAQLMKPSIIKSARRVFVVGVGMTKVIQILSFFRF